MVAGSPPPPTPLHVEFALSHLIARSSAPLSTMPGRLAAFEGVLASLAGTWRPQRPIRPAGEVRMSRATLDELLAWLEQEPFGERNPIDRVALYASGAVTDDDVPPGWIRLRLGAEQPSGSVGP